MVCTDTVVMNFEQLVLASRNTGSEVGDINHSSDFPPRVVDESNQLLCQQLVDCMLEDKLGFPFPFSIIVDKDESYLRLEIHISIVLSKFRILVSEYAWNFVYWQFSVFRGTGLWFTG